MKPYQAPLNEAFVGRETERRRLEDLGEQQSPAIVVVYGRRRVGKTELLEQTYRNRFLIKLEGLENKPQQAQMDHVMYQLAKYLEDPYVAKIQFT
ncbi:unnamed protein product, partial [marine sediment metagenome]